MTQAQALTILKTGANVFLTGEPGSGKTHTVNAYVAYLRSCGIEPAITASTGIASTHIGGMTIHSWSGIGVKNYIGEEDLDEMMQRERLVKRLREATVLIIDEVSMLSSNTLDAVEVVCRTLRGNGRAFGGLQVVLVGDFFQLPPVVKQSYDDFSSYIDEHETPFAFRADAWLKANMVVCYLSEQHRQDDEVFLEMLTSIRRGDIHDGVHACLRGRCVPAPESMQITKLFPHNANVDTLNNVELGKIKEDNREFAMRGSGAGALVESLKRNCLSPEVLSLKVGAKVMFTKNSIDGAYVNGTVGEVIGFSKMTTYPIVRIKFGREMEVEPNEWSIQDGNRVLARIVQVPLRLAWAITVHKSQGMSLDSASIDLSRAFEYGQGYVALSRVRTLDGLYLSGFNERALQVHPKVSEYDSSFREISDIADETFSSMDQAELLKMQENFIKACGGIPGMGRRAKKKAPKESTYEATKELVLKGKSPAEVASERGVTLGTVVSHLEKLVAEKKLDPDDVVHLKPEKKRFEAIARAFERVEKKEGKMLLSPTLSILGSGYDFEELRLARLFLGK